MGFTPAEMSAKKALDDCTVKIKFEIFTWPTGQLEVI
jgi:hypothetical protein